MTSWMVVILWIVLGLIGEYLFFKLLLEKGQSISVAHIVGCVILGPLLLFCVVLYSLDKITLIRK